MNRGSSFALALLACGISGCGDAGSKHADMECFQLVEGETTTILQVYSDAIVTYERSAGVDLVPPERASGKRNQQGFRYPNGTQLQIADERLTWPESSMLSGEVFESCDCPDD